MMIVDGYEIAWKRLQQFHPLALISEKHIDRLLVGASIVRLEKGRFLFRKKPRPDISYRLTRAAVAH